MPTFLSDPPQTLYLVLGAVLVVTAAVAARKQDRKSLIPAGVALGVLLLLLLLDRMVESPREEAVRRLEAMVHAADARNADAFIAHVADTLEYKGMGLATTVTREQVKTSGFWHILRSNNVHVAAWDFARDDTKQIDPNTVEVGFLAKGEADGKQFPVYIRATFKKQPTGEMKLSRFESYDAIKRQNEAISVPGFP